MKRESERERDLISLKPLRRLVRDKSVVKNKSTNSAYTIRTMTEPHCTVL